MCHFCANTGIGQEPKLQKYWLLSNRFLKHSPSAIGQTHAKTHAIGWAASFETYIDVAVSQPKTMFLFTLEITHIPFKRLNWAYINTYNIKTVCCFCRVYKKTSGNGSVRFPLYCLHLPLLSFASYVHVSFKIREHDNHLSHDLLQLCLYLGRRDFVDHVESVDSIGMFHFTLKNVLFIKIVRSCLFFN